MHATQGSFLKRKTCTGVIIGGVAVIPRSAPCWHTRAHCAAPKCDQPCVVCRCLVLRPVLVAGRGSSLGAAGGACPSASSIASTRKEASCCRWRQHFRRPSPRGSALVSARTLSAAVLAAALRRTSAEAGGGGWPPSPPPVARMDAARARAPTVAAKAAAPLFRPVRPPSYLPGRAHCCASSAIRLRLLMIVQLRTRRAAMGDRFTRAAVKMVQ